MLFETLVREKIELKRNQILLGKSPVDDHVYYVYSGTVRAYIMVGDKEQNVRFAYTSEIFTHVDSFLQNVPSVYYIEAIKGCELGVIPKSVIMEWLNTSPDGMNIWNKMLVSQLLGSLEREIDLLIDKPEERLARVLLRSPRLFQEIPLKHIANYLRMTPETLSRIKK